MTKDSRIPGLFLDQKRSARSIPAVVLDPAVGPPAETGTHARPPPSVVDPAPWILPNVSSAVITPDVAMATPSVLPEMAGEQTRMWNASGCLGLGVWVFEEHQFKTHQGQC